MKTSGLKKKEQPASKNDVIVTVIKPTGDNGIKIRRMRVVVKFVCKVLGIDYFEDDNIFQLVASDEPCDHIWFKDNVFRYVDIDCSDISLVDARADKLVETYHLKDLDETHKVGIGIIKYYVQDMYMQVSIWRCNGGE